jgi:hypothetical protein
MKWAYGVWVSETNICNSGGYWLNPLTEKTQPKLLLTVGTIKQQQLRFTLNLPCTKHFVVLSSSNSSGWWGNVTRTEVQGVKSFVQHQVGSGRTWVSHSKPKFLAKMACFLLKSWWPCGYYPKQNQVILFREDRRRHRKAFPGWSGRKFCEGFSLVILTSTLSVELQHLTTPRGVVSSPQLLLNYSFLTPTEVG